MSARHWKAVVVLSLLAVIDVAMSARVTATWRPHAGGPQVASIGEVLGWASSALLLAAIGAVVIDARWIRQTQRRTSQVGDAAQQNRPGSIQRG